MNYTPLVTRQVAKWQWMRRLPIIIVSVFVFQCVMCICVYLCVLCLFSLYLSLSLYLSSTDATTIWGWERLLPIVPPCKSRL